ncbi:MAG TPA: hypothetical protein VIX82_01085 [Solirubrobacteraceae bacterium]
MRFSRLGASAACLALGPALAGCGGGAQKIPTLADLPLVKGAAVVAHVRQCDHGASAYCAIELVVVDNHYHSSTELVVSEKQALRKMGWTRNGPDISQERAADSPNRNLRVTYATALGELTGIDLGWIQRPRTITLALSQSVFNRSPAMAVMLELGVS